MIVATCRSIDSAGKPTSGRPAVKITTIAIAAVIASVAASSAFAGTPVINLRQDIQGHRIYNGIASGRLSYGESQRLIAGQEHVSDLKAQARADGVVTPWERAHIQAVQDVQSARIFHLKHN